MKSETTIYIIDSKIIGTLPINYEGQFIEINIEINFSNQIEECHGIHNLCTYEFEVKSIYVRTIEMGCKKVICDITDNFQDIVSELILKTNLIF